jgi:hypothetical protein
VALTRWVLGALLLSGVIAACREVSICADANECPVEASAGRGATTDRASGGGGSANGNGDEAGLAGQPGQPGQGGQAPDGVQDGEAGQAGQVAAGNAGASGETSQNECPHDSGECDGSTLTTCETDLLTSVRHCGGCERACDGLCVLGICKAPELMFKGAGFSDFVLTHEAAFMVLSNYSNSRLALYRFDLQSGKASLVMELEYPENSISLGPDRVYVHVFDGVFAVTLDGSRVELVEKDGFAISPFSFGATAQGIYFVHFEYLEGAEGEPPEESWTLYHRPHLSTKWQVLERSSYLRILASGSGCLAIERGTEENPELSLVVGTEVTKIDGLPAEWDDLLVVENELVLLTSEPNQLWWFDSSGPLQHYAVEPPTFSWDALTLTAPRGVAIQSRSGDQESVRTYTRDGPALWAAGISRKAALLFVNRPELWYVYSANWADPPVLYRAPMLEEADL